MGKNDRRSHQSARPPDPDDRAKEEPYSAASWEFSSSSDPPEGPIAVSELESKPATLDFLHDSGHYVQPAEALAVALEAGYPELSVKVGVTVTGDTRYMKVFCHRLSGQDPIFTTNILAGVLGPDQHVLLRNAMANYGLLRERRT